MFKKSLLHACVILVFIGGQIRLYASEPPSGIFASALMANNWCSISELALLSVQEQRAAVITDLSDVTAIPRKLAESADANQLVHWCFLYRWLACDEGVRPGRLRKMGPEELRDLAIERLVRIGSHNRTDLEWLDAAALLRLCNGMTISTRLAGEIKSLENVGEGNSFFQLRDNLGNLMDVLKVFPSGQEYTYLGFYHTQVDHNVFELKMAGSDDLVHWTFLRNLGENDHQADVAEFGDGFILVNETDRTPEGNNLRIRYFSTFSSLMIGRAGVDIILPHSFETPAEGTPAIRMAEGNNPSDHTLLIGFHYFNKMTGADELAFGTLRNFDASTWSVWRDDFATNNIRAMGYHGNIGTRSSTLTGGFSLQEAQRTIGDWAAWNILLGDHYFYTLLAVQTPSGAVSFANPKIGLSINRDEYIVTYFLPMHGNPVSEVGTLLYKPVF